MNSQVKKLKGANMDIDFSVAAWGDSQCLWNVSENTNVHKCAVKNTSICKYFCGVQLLDSVLCCYPHEATSVLSKEDMDRETKDGKFV